MKKKSIDYIFNYKYKEEEEEISGIIE